VQEEKQVEESAEQEKERSQIRSIRLQRIEKELHPTMDKKERTIS